MKDSGVAWLGEIPLDWQFVRACDLFRKTKTTGRADAELLSVYREYGVIPKASRDDNMNRPSDDLSVYQFVKVGDLVLNKMKTWQGSIAVSKYEGIVSPAYYVARPLVKMSLDFVHHLLRSPNYIDRYAALSSGVRVNQWDLSYDDFKAIPVPLPSLDEQLAIADYIDQQTALIDQRLSTLEEKKTVLAELRKATIHEAVTKGLNKNAPMKESGIAWIGEIPQGWDVRRMKDCYISNNRVQPNSTILSLSYGKVIVKNVTEKKGVTPDSYDTYQGVHPGDVVLRLTDLQNDQKSLRVGRATSKGIITSAYLCVSSRILNDRYSAYLLHDVGDIQKLFYGLGGGVRQSMKFADLAELLFSLPPANEQLAIANHLDQQTHQIDAQLATLDEQALVLKELRKAIIHEAVTGKIDLSGVVSGKEKR